VVWLVESPRQNTPEFYPLKLMRGMIEQVEIMGAVIALVAGYRAAAAERGRQTLALILTRPLPHWEGGGPHPSLPSPAATVALRLDGFGRL